MIWGGGYEFSIMSVVSPPLGQLVSHHSVIFHLLVLLINLLILTWLSLSDNSTLNSISRRRGGIIIKSSIHSRRRPGVRSGGRKWGWKYEKSWLYDFGSWYPWNQELITQNSMTHPKLPRRTRNHQRIKRWICGKSRRTGQGWINHWRYIGSQGYTDCLTKGFGVMQVYGSLNNSGQFFEKYHHQADHIW